MNNMLQAERVHTGFLQEVKTPVGEVYVRYSKGSVEVAFHARNGTAWPEFSVVDGEPTMNVKVGPKPPSVGDEVTQDGRTFEVMAVRYTDGRHMLQDDLGAWYRWKESK